VNEPLLGINVKAVVGINRDPKLKGEIHAALLKIFQVISISEVTGRFDILVTISATTLEELHNVVIKQIGKIEGVQNTETFVEMQRTEKERIFTSEYSRSCVEIGKKLLLINAYYIMSQYHIENISKSS